MKKLYYGRRELGSKCAVFYVEGKQHQPLPPCNDIWNHSPDGFEWGYHGSGPAQLALAILHHITGCPHLSVELHQSFKRDFVARFDRDLWRMDRDEIVAWIFQACEDRWSCPSRFAVQPWGDDDA